MTDKKVGNRAAIDIPKGHREWVAPEARVIVASSSDIGNSNAGAFDLMDQVFNEAS